LEAVQKAEELRRDVILLDIGLPKLHGIEATLQIQQRASDSAILILERNLGL
jgi:DNA-binding NarL/FixJ family response regulator